MIIGELWHQAKKRAGSRASRKRDTKRKGSKSAVQRVRIAYAELLEKLN